MRLLGLCFLGLLLAGQSVSGSEALNGKLSISIAVFDAGIPEDMSTHRDLDVFPRIRAIESLILPFVLRETLEASSAWDIVRVVPEMESAAELSVLGTILSSDGNQLELGIRVVDAIGRVWVDKTYSGSVESDYAETNGGLADYQALYDAIAKDIQAELDSLDDREIRRISEVSLIRYANEIVPTAFEGYLDVNGDGGIEVLRLPAGDDPMIERIRLVRETELVITDAVDAKYQELHSETIKVYDLWRKYRRQNIDYQAENERRANKKTGYDAGSFEALKRVYDVYKWDRITAQEQDDLAIAFNNEVGPKVDAMEEQVAELQVWVDRKYAEWHRILEELFEVETREFRPEVDASLPRD